MLISGVQNFTMLDYPGKTSCIVFTPGCNFRCGYCHNPEFVLPDKIKEIRDSFIPENIFFNFLERRVDLLDGVVVTGGEPTLMPDLEEFIKKIKKMGFLVKLDSNGNRPEVLINLLDKGLVDYVAMDVKTSLPEYANLVGGLVRPENIQKSMELLMNGYVEYEFRTTLVKDVHRPEILKNMQEILKGAKVLYLQKFRSGNTLKPDFQNYKSFTDEELQEIKEMFEKVVQKVEIRE
jgi:pyruvate formate lyase activating enzyme